MAGQIKTLIDGIVKARSKGKPFLEEVTRTKLRLKGLELERYTPQSEDDPALLERIRSIAKDMGVNPEGLA